MTLWIVVAVMIGTLCILFGVVAGVTTEITTKVGRIHKRVTDLENSAKEFARQLWDLQHPTCKCENCVAERKRSAEKVGSSTDFSKTVSTIPGVGKTGKETESVVDEPTVAVGVGGFPTDFAKRVGALYASRKTGKEMDQ